MIFIVKNNSQHYIFIIVNDIVSKELIAYDPKMEFVSGMKIRNSELMILSNKYHLHIYNVYYNNNTFNSNEINFRVLSIPIAEIKKNTKCFSSCNY